MQASASNSQTAFTTPWWRSQLESYSGRLFKTNFSSVILYILVSAALVWGHPTTVSLLIGGLASLLGLCLRIVVAGYGYKADIFAVVGPYRWLRHPYLLGSLLFYFGIVLSSRDVLIAAFAVVALVLILREKFLIDEEHWRHCLGLDWPAYHAYVPAILPRILPIAQVKEKISFSLSLGLFAEPHREIFSLGCWGLTYLTFYFSALLRFNDGPSGDLFQTAVVITTVGYPIVRLVFHGALPYARTALYSRSRLSRSAKPTD